MINAFMQWDRVLFLQINSYAGSHLDYLLGWPSYLGEFYFFLPITFLLLLIWDPKNVLQNFLKVAICIFIAGALNSFLKEIFDRPRPWGFFYKDIDQGLVDVTYLFAMDTAESFPSGHTTAVFALAAALHQLYGKKVLWVYLFAAWIGISRVFCGAHFPSDVLAGAATGIVIARLIWQPISAIEKKGILNLVPKRSAKNTI